MNTRNNIIFVFQCCVALFLSLQIWVWLRFGGALLASDSFDLMASLFKSMAPFKTSLEGFYIFVLPVVVVSYFTFKHTSSKLFVNYSAMLGALFSTFYFFTISFFDLAFIKSQILIYVAVGGVSGFAYGAILKIPIGKKSRIREASPDFYTRRKIAGSIGLLTGGIGIAGSLLGPFYFWRNRNNYIDINLSTLKNGERIAVEVGNRPIWVIRRSPELIELLSKENKQLRDPDSLSSKQPQLANNQWRSIQPEYFVVEGLCTHLGCVPTYLPEGDDRHSKPDPLFYCPCHGGAFDMAGRVYNDTPPPMNMVIPPHEYISTNVLRLYYPSLAAEWRRS